MNHLSFSSFTCLFCTVSSSILWLEGINILSAFFNCSADITAALNGAMYLQTDTEIKAHRRPACLFPSTYRLNMDKISPCEDLFWSQCSVNHPLVMLFHRSRFQCFNGVTEQFNSCRSRRTSGWRENSELQVKLTKLSNFNPLPGLTTNSNYSKCMPTICRMLLVK